MKKFNIEFMFPTVAGAVYDHESKTAFIFGKLDPEEVCQSITHEVIHYLIQKIAGTKTSFKFDKIAKKVRKFDSEVFNMLY